MAFNLDNEIKKQLIENLWINAYEEYGSIIRPRTKVSNMELKLFSLTNYPCYDEIELLLQKDIIKKEDVRFWSNSMMKIYRLQAVGLKPLSTGGDFEERIILDEKLRNGINFDIINLDFTSQNMNLIPGRIEKELNSIEEIVRLSRKNVADIKHLCVGYTTLLDDVHIDTDCIRANLKKHATDSWLDCSLSKVDDTDTDKMMKLINNVQNEIFIKYKFNIIQNMEFTLISKPFTVFSNVSLIEVI